MALADHQDLIADLAGGLVAALGTAARDRALARAVVRYGQDRPRRLVVDVTAGAGGTLTFPAGGDPALPVSLEHPIGDDPPTLIEPDRWTLYATPTGTEIRVTGGLPTGAVVRVTHGARHTVDAGTDTVPAADLEAVASWAAALLCDQEAARTAGDTLSTIQSDSVQHASVSGNWARRATALRARYHELLGVDPKRVAPASAEGAVPSGASWGGAHFQQRRRDRARLGGGVS